MTLVATLLLLLVPTASALKCFQGAELADQSLHIVECGVWHDRCRTMEINCANKETRSAVRCGESFEARVPYHQCASKDVCAGVSIFSWFDGCCDEDRCNEPSDKYKTSLANNEMDGEALDKTLFDVLHTGTPEDLFCRQGVEGDTIPVDCAAETGSDLCSARVIDGKTTYACGIESICAQSPGSCCRGKFCSGEPDKAVQPICRSEIGAPLDGFYTLDCANSDTRLQCGTFEIDCATSPLAHTYCAPLEIENGVLKEARAGCLDEKTCSGESDAFLDVECCDGDYCNDRPLDDVDRVALCKHGREGQTETFNCAKLGPDYTVCLYLAPSSKNDYGVYGCAKPDSSVCKIPSATCCQGSFCTGAPDSVVQPLCRVTLSFKSKHYYSAHCDGADKVLKCGIEKVSGVTKGIDRRGCMTESDCAKPGVYCCSDDKCNDELHIPVFREQQSTPESSSAAQYRSAALALLATNLALVAIISVLQ